MKAINLTPHELAQKTVNDMAKKRKLEKEGQRQAVSHGMENINKINRRISHSRY